MASNDSNAVKAPVRYVPDEIEGKWMRHWLDAGVFEARAEDGGEPYAIMLPPPNVTGALHMGHALNGSIQDALIRFWRMRGRNALWQPGVDHAGIATQAVVERMLRAEGVSRHDLGRERFLERVWEWKHEYGSQIITQYKRLGASLDYRRERFTMDEQYARAVLEAFTRLYDKGYIYRDNYLVNWDAGTMSAISDLEVRQVELTDELVSVAYELVDGSGEIVVATVRPETIVADVAVAVHPDDTRYAHLVGAQVKVPLTDRTVPVIADDYVKIDFGTGALKITPGHDPNDFEIGRRHGLPELTCINFDRTMTELAGEFAGMGADEARGAMVAKLEDLGLVRDREPYTHMVPHSDRSGVRIEPLISLQWFCDMTELAKPAVELVESGEVRFVPEGAKNIFMTWMQNIKPWCLSRQLWWGHQLPVWYRGDEVHVSVDGPADAAAQGWVRDEDVLDTWFSSGLWDFATLGWPDKTPDLEFYHPTSVLCTAREIINLWVARMMMLSLEFLGEKPFSDVYIHTIVQAPDGRRMSKSLGTGIDPIELMDKFGADATRYGMLNMSSTQDARFNEGKISEGRDLANKLWNASRLLVMLGDMDAVRGGHWLTLDSLTHLEDRWIWSRLHRTIVELTGLMEEYDFALYTKSLYAFVWNELCDWYLEAVKPRLRSEDAAERAHASTMLSMVLNTTIRLVHPVMPHITEEIAEQLWGSSEAPRECVATSSWPTATHDLMLDDAWVEAESLFGGLQDVVSRIRSLRQAAGVAPAVRIPVRIEWSGPAGAEASTTSLLAALAGTDAGLPADDSGITLPLGGGTVTVYGLDPALLISRLEADLRTARSELTRAEGKLGNAKFVAGAPAELVEEERAKVVRFTADVEQLAAIIEQM
jgi:valyl-tRNA synthetase